MKNIVSAQRNKEIFARSIVDLVRIYENMQEDPLFSRLMPVVLSTIHQLQGIKIALENFIAKGLNIDYSCVDGSLKYIVLNANNFDAVTDSLLSMCHKSFFSQVVISTETIFLGFLSKKPKWEDRQYKSIIDFIKKQQYSNEKVLIGKISPLERAKPTFDNICKEIKKYYFAKDEDAYPNNLLSSARILRNASSHGSDIALSHHDIEILTNAWSDYPEDLKVNKNTIILSTSFYAIFLSQIIKFIQELKLKQDDLAKNLYENHEESHPNPLATA